MFSLRKNEQDLRKEDTRRRGEYSNFFIEFIFAYFMHTCAS
jgi:hypothetical protein